MAATLEGVGNVDEATDAIGLTGWLTAVVTTVVAAAATVVASPPNGKEATAGDATEKAVGAAVVVANLNEVPLPPKIPVGAAAAGAGTAVATVLEGNEKLNALESADGVPPNTGCVGGYEFSLFVVIVTALSLSKIF